MLPLQPPPSSDADAVDCEQSPNSQLGGSHSFQLHPQRPRIDRNYNSFGNPRVVQSDISSGKNTRYSLNSSNLNRSESGSPAWRVGTPSNGFGNPRDAGFSPATQITPGHHERSNDSDGIEFKAQMQIEDDADASSPPLWKTGPPPAAPAIRVTSPSHYAQLSPASRSQAIARGRQELMRLVQDMPESAYELSLKDIVETSANGNFEEASKEDERALVYETIKEEKMIRTRRSGRRRELPSRNIQNGAFLIKMFSPSALGSLKRSSSTGTSSKVSPRPMGAEEKSSDGEWWKIRFNVAGGEGERSRINKSIRSSSSSSTSSNRHMDGFLSGCWSFLSINKTKGRERRGCLF